MSTLQVIPVRGLPEVGPGDDIAALIAAAAVPADGDVVVVTQKIVSKAEGRVVPIDRERAAEERTAWVVKESVRIVARRGDVVIAETKHGFVCANAGVDASNVAPGSLALLPEDPDESARRIRDRLAALTGRRVAVIVSDTFGRPWRVGQTDVAIGVAGMAPVMDYVGTRDAHGRVLEATQIAVADEIAGAAELVMGKADGIPVAIVRGLKARGDGSAQLLVRPPDEDLFRTGAIE